MKLAAFEISDQSQSPIEAQVRSGRFEVTT
jgi:hypothetical protein